MKKKIKIIVIAIVIFSILSSNSLFANAQAGYAYAFGGEFFLPEDYYYDDIRQAADYAALMGYRSYYNGLLTYSYVNSSKLNSDIIYFSCHGSPDGLFFYNSGLQIMRDQGNSTDTINLSNWTLNNTKLMIADACSAAQAYPNICCTAWEQGADCVLGWITIISTESINWLRRFYAYLERGKTIQQAIDYADSFNDYSSGSHLKNHYAYGDTSQILQKNSKSGVLETTDPRAHTIPTVKFDNNSKDYTALAKALQAEFPDFCLDQYQVTISDTSKGGQDFVVDFNRTVNGCWTPTGYTMIFKNGETNVVFDNTSSYATRVEQVSNASYPITTESTINQAKAEAAKRVPSGNQVISQKGEICYLPENDGYCYRVYTLFGPQGTAYERIMTFDYPLIQREGG